MRRPSAASPNTRVLVIDDQARTAELLARLAPELSLVPAGDPLRPYARSWREAEAAMRSGSRGPDLAVLDLRFEIPDEDLLPDRRPLGEGTAARRERALRRDRQGLYILERLRFLNPDLPVVLTTAHEEIPFEDEARKLRADAFTYSVGEDETTGEDLVRLVRRVLAERDAPLSTGRFYWGRGTAMRELRRRIASLAPTPMPLLVTGATGTGKNFLVREVIHPLSGRKGPFVAFDCATVPESLLPAALFGSVRGSYTGSVADRPGVFEAAAGGTLFLDEIENLSLEAQKSLLQALNDGVIRRIGSSSEIPHTARIVAASNSDLKAKVIEGTFRADLLMRLNPALALRLPRLAERLSDLEDLARGVARRFFADPAHVREIVSQIRAAGGAEPDTDADFELALDDPALLVNEAPALFCFARKGWSAMTRHPWPGNLRQFEMVLTDLLAASVFAGGGPTLDQRGRALFTVDPALLFDLLAESEADVADSGSREEMLVLPKPRVTSIEAFRRELERTVFRMLFRETRGDFERMAERLTGNRQEAHSVRLRFNKIGLSARAER